jgi:hypothetical protein
MTLNIIDAPVQDNYGTYTTHPTYAVAGTTSKTSSIMVSSSPLTLPRPRYGFDDQPEFVDGDIVEVDLSYFGIEKVPGEQNIIEAMIVGRQVGQGFIQWMVEIDKDSFPSYPYRVLQIPTYALIKQERLKWEE